MTASGSVSAGQEFFAQGAKPPRRFRDRGSAPRMADDGWIGEGLLFLAYPAPILLRTQTYPINLRNFVMHLVEHFSFDDA